MAVVTVINNGATVAITVDGSTYDIPKPFKIKVDGNYVTIIDEIKNQEYVILYSDCTNPVAVSAVALRNAIVAFIVDEAALLTSIAASISSLSYYGDIVMEIQQTGLYRGQAARVIHLLARRNAFTATNVFNDIGEAIGVAAAVEFPVLAAGTLCELVSADVQDAAGMTGVQSVRLVYINTSYALVQSAAIALNGATVPAGLADILQPIWIESESVGSAGVSVGNITLRTTVGSIPIVQITAKNNRSMDSLFMIPDGYKGYVKQWHAGSIQNAQDVRLRATINSFTGSLSSRYTFIDNTYQPSNTREQDISADWIKLPARAKVKVSTISSSVAAQTRCDSGITLILIAD